MKPPVLPPPGTISGTRHVLEDADHNLYGVGWVELADGSGVWTDQQMTYSPDMLAKKGYLYYAPLWINVLVEGINCPERSKKNG